MRRDLLKERNVVRIKLPTCRQEFDATVTGFEPGGWVRILPVESWPSWRRIRLTDITERIDPPMRRRKGAVA
jgi:hypothetical protein